MIEKKQAVIASAVRTPMGSFQGVFSSIPATTLGSQAIAEALLEEHLQELKAKGLQDSFDLLTNREKEILQLLAEGRSNKEVAHLLNLSTLTIETHRSNLMQKLNLHNTAEIVLYAVRKKIIS